MFFEYLATELVTQIFLSLPTVDSVIALASSCHRFNNISKSSRRLLILGQAAEAQYGPLRDATQLVTHNASQPAHVVRDAPLSEALLRHIVRVGRVAAKWESIYPYKKWREDEDFLYRRELCDEERYRLRRALYRLWLFSKAFHNSDQRRNLRNMSETTYRRAALLHNFSAVELAEMLDVHNILRSMVSNNICPSNGTIRRKFSKRFPDSNHQLLFNIHLNYPPPSSFAPETHYHSSPYMASKFHNKYQPSRLHEPGAEGWGDDIGHYYVVEDMMKLDPEQILWLKEHAPYKGQVEAYVRGLGEWFENNGETFVQTLQFVVQQRGGDVEELKAAVKSCELGVALE
ncbi:hypothetical protein LTR66_011169 [Elasticomyces elasticus]|nr:hypothetical protein LTR66_011169 [Elasticomyces elasticus]